MKIGFFDEAENVKSSTRLFSFISLLTAVGIAGFGVWTTQVDANLIALISMFLVAAFAPKVVQKFAEIKAEQKTP